MITIALRFGETFSPEEGTIQAHQNIINEHGFVWYGKLGSALSEKTINEVLGNDNPKILLIHSGTYKRYWAYIDEISRTQPELEYVPSYYHCFAGEVKAWFKIRCFEKAANNVLSQCIVRSNGSQLSLVSRRNISPYFIIDYRTEKEVNHGEDENGINR